MRRRRFPYWISDIRNDRLIAYSDIHENKYSVVRKHSSGSMIAPRLLPEC